MPKIRRFAYWLLTALMAGGGLGCAAAPRTTPTPRPRTLSVDEVIARVNRNSAGMGFVLRAGGVSATGEFQQGDRLESFQLRGVMLYRRPRDLYLKLDHIGGTLEAGSNEEEFWFWEKIQEPRYSWGRHDQMGSSLDADIPLRPDLLADVLGLGDLPTDTTGPLGPVVWAGADVYELLFLARDETGQLYLRKAVDISRTEPCLVRSTVYFNPDGQPVLQVRLSDYQLIEDTEVFAPRRLHLKWLPEQGWMELTFATLKAFDSPAAESRFRSPRQRGLSLGEVRRVDEPRPVASPSKHRPSSGPASQPTSQPSATPES